MADRTSAEIFSAIFVHLANQPDRDVHLTEEATDRDKKFAKWLWTKSFDYDFSRYQMGCDKALVHLGLARYNVEKISVYANGDGSFDDDV